jgi:hypothetical protein
MTNDTIEEMGEYVDEFGGVIRRVYMKHALWKFNQYLKREEKILPPATLSGQSHLRRLVTRG